MTLRIFSCISFSPTGGVAFALLFFFLNLNPHHGKSLREHINEFDFLGLLLIIGGVVCLLIGFNFSETSCEFYKCDLLCQRAWTDKHLTGSTPQTIAPLVVGVVLLIIASINEIFTTRSPIIPPRLFKVRTTAFLLITTFLHAFAFFGGKSLNNTRVLISI